MSQNKRVIDWLKAGKTISDNEARDLLGIERLGARICELRKAGFPIGDKWEEGVNRYGDETKWKRYFLVIGGENELPNYNSGQASKP